jgi:hypothetical protein
LIRDLEIENPEGFEGKVFAKIPEIYVSVDFQKLLRGEMVHLREVRLDLAEVNIEKNKRGVSNISLLSTVGAPAPPTEPKPEAPSKEMPFHIDLLVLSIGKVGYADHSSRLPVGLSAHLRVNQERFEGINTPAALVNLILLKIVRGTAFGNIGVSTDMLTGSLRNVVGSGQDVLKGTASVLTDQTKSLAGAATGLGQDGAGSLGGTVSSAKDAVGGLWGKVKSTVTSSDSSGS